MLPLTRLTLAVGAAAALTGYAPPGVKPNVVTVTASDFKFDAPDTIAAGLTTIRLVNKGPGLHHVVLVRADEGTTSADVMAALEVTLVHGRAVAEVGADLAEDEGDEHRI